jgi:hypothetical protein
MGRYNAEYKLRSERLLGEMLQETDMNKGERGQFTGGNIVLPPVAPPTLSEQGINKMGSSRWQAIFGQH